MDRMNHIWGVARAHAKDIVRVSLHMAVNSITSKGSVVFGGRCYEFEGLALPQDRDSQLFHDITQMEQRLGICDATPTVETSTGVDPSWDSMLLPNHPDYHSNVVAGLVSLLRRLPSYQPNKRSLEEYNPWLSILEPSQDPRLWKANHVSVGKVVCEPWISRPLGWPSFEQETYEPEVLGLVGGTEVSCLPDIGAACNFMSLQHAERHGITVIPPDTNSRTTRLGNGKQVEIAGHATLPFSFKGEAESHQLEFIVLPRCIKDVILGSPFLRLTKLFEHHAHRIVRKIRKFPGFQACYTASQERVVGMLDGELVHALPDTGSDVMLVSENYAKRRGLQINYDSHYCFPLTFADGSQSWTSGIAKNVPWQYGTEGGKTTLCDFYVLKDLQCDVLLSYDFLHRTEAFSLHGRWMNLQDDSTDSANRANTECILSTITRNSTSSNSDSYLKRLRRKLHSGGKQANPVAAPCQSDSAADGWDREHRRLLRNLQTIDEQMSKLPSGPLQDDARVAFEAAKAAFEQHMASRPGVPATPTGVPSSSSTSTTATSNTGS
jgi:predicted aspartyl protease